MTIRRDMLGSGLLRDFVIHARRAKWAQRRYRIGAGVLVVWVVLEIVAAAWAVWEVWVVLAKIGT